MENVYKSLLKDEKGFKILSNFHYSKWKNLTIGERKKTFVNLEKIISQITGDEETAVVFSGDYGENGAFGNYESQSNQLIINDFYLNDLNGTQYDVLNTFVHERRHRFQKDIIDGKIVGERLARVGENTKKIWQRNQQADLFLGKDNYFSGLSASEEEKLKYYYQDLENDAFYWGNEIAIMVGKELEKTYGKDEKLNLYLMKELKEFSEFAVDEEKIKEIKNTVNKTWEENENYINSIQQKTIKHKALLNNIESLNEDSFLTFFNEYIWFNLNQKERFMVLKELQNKEIALDGGNPIDIRYDEKKGLYIGNSLYTNNEIPALLYLENFYSMFHNNNVIEKSKAQSDDKLMKELKMNLHIIDGYLINFYFEDRAPLLFLAQPFGEDRCNYLHQKMSRIFPYATKNIVKKNENYFLFNDWKMFLNRNDYKNVKKITERIYNAPFENIRDHIVHLMADKIIEKEKNAKSKKRKQ